MIGVRWVKGERVKGPGFVDATLDLRDQFITFVEHASAAFDGENFSIQVHEVGFASGSNAMQIVLVWLSVSFHFSNGEAVERDASFPQKRGEPSNGIEGLLAC